GEDDKDMKKRGAKIRKRYSEIRIEERETEGYKERKGSQRKGRGQHNSEKVLQEEEQGLEGGLSKMRLNSW
ncbi:MAG: hypothetical protein ACK559_37920, partial [bacterium]